MQLRKAFALFGVGLTSKFFYYFLITMNACIYWHKVCSNVANHRYPPERARRSRRRDFVAGAWMMTIHSRKKLRRAWRIAGAALMAIWGVAVIATNCAGNAAAAERQFADLSTLSSPLGANDLDRVRGHGLDGATTAGGNMQVGIILWDEYRGRQPSQGGGGSSSTSSSTVLPSGATSFAITTKSLSSQR